MGKVKYYSLDKIKKLNATYNVIFGKRSNGKTYAVLNEILEQYFKNGKQGAIIRRMYEDFRSTRGANIFSSLVENNVIQKLSLGRYDGVAYFNRSWFLTYYDEKLDRNVRCEKPFCYAFALSSTEHDKSTSYPNITTVLFDEFISRYNYLTDEFILFQNELSTIIRDRTDVKIYMLGNSINVYCPYFNEMGLNHVKNMKQGDIDLYTYGEDGALTVAVEFCENLKTASSNKYFAFDNPKLNMITNGFWEISPYPHLPYKYARHEVVFRCVIIFDNLNFDLEVINHNGLWGFIHNRTKDIDYDNEFILSTVDDARPNVCSNITRPKSVWENKIADLFKYHKMFYQNNQIGCTIENFVNTCRDKNKHM